MSDVITFNRMTIMAAANILTEMLNQTTFDELTVEWDLDELSSGPSVRSKLTQVARVALENEHTVFTADGPQPLRLAMVEKAMRCSKQIKSKHSDIWVKLKTGLRFDSFEIVEEQFEAQEESLFGGPRYDTKLTLKRMLPEDVPELNFREAESELLSLLKKHKFEIPLGHLGQAFKNFSSGDWAAANASMRAFYEGYLDEVANRLGYIGKGDAHKRRKYLANCQPPFFLDYYNEPRYVQDLMNRMHPQGSHPGLSEEDDCTFRLQITLISARLFIRRYGQRLNGTP